MKKINGILLAGAMALSVGGALAMAMPKEAKVVKEAQAAIGNGQLYVGGVDINTQTDKKVTGGSGYAQLSGTTLTLHDYTYSGPGTIIHKKNYQDTNWRGAIMYIGTDNLTIKVEGTNSITLDNSNWSFRTYGIGFRPGNGEDSSGNEQIRSNTLTFTGDGSLYVKSGQGQVSAGIGACSTGAISFNGPDCTFSGATFSSSSSGDSEGSMDDEGGSSAQLRINSGNITFIGDIGYTSVGISNDKMYQGGGVLRAESRVSSGDPWRPYGIWGDEMIFNGGVAYVSSAIKDGIENGTLKVGPNMTKLVVTGARTAIRGLSTWSSKVEQEAYAWDNVEGSGQAITIASGAKEFSNDYKKVQIGGVIKADVSGYSGAYDGAEHSISVSVTKPTSGATIKYGTSAGVYNLTETPKYSALGTHTTYYQITADDYDTLTGSANVSIGKADFVSASVTLNGEAPTYDGNPHTPVVTAAAETVDGCDYAFSYSTSQEGTYGEMPSFTEAGEHTVYWKVVAENHNDATGSFQYIINKPYVTEPSVTLTSEPFIYDGTAKTPTVSTAGETSDSSPITFTYSTSETGSYSENLPSFTNAGEHTVYWKAEADGYETVTGSFVVNIAKANSSYGSEPSTKSGLHYTGSAQELVNAGTSETGTIMYRVGEEGEFSSTIPTATDVGEYKVYYYIKGDNNHIDSEVKYVTISISANDKSLLNDTIDSGDKVYNMLAESNPEAAEALKAVLDAAKVVQENPNVTAAAIQEAVDNILGALVTAVTTLIDDIGEVKYNKDSQEAIENAREAYDLLPDEQKAEVGEEKLEVLVAAEEKYQKLKAAANSGLPAGIVVLIVLLSILLVLCGAYFLLFFVFNKWIKGSNKPQRVFKLKVEGMRVKLLAMNFRVIERFECDVYDTREEALKK